MKTNTTEQLANRLIEIAKDLQNLNKPEDKGAVLIEQAKKMYPKDKGVVLIEQAKKMYPKGTKYKPVESMFPVNEITSELRYGYYGNDGIDCDEGGFVYLNGVWATIIQEPIIIDGKEVKIEDNVVYFGRCIMGKELVRNLQSLNPIFTEILKRMEEKNG